VDGISMKNITLKYNKDDFRIPMVLDDVHHADFQTLKIPTVLHPPAVWIRKSTDVFIKKLSSPYPLKDAVKKMGQ
jgi:hypothetical protein